VVKREVFKQKWSIQAALGGEILMFSGPAERCPEAVFYTFRTEKHGMSELLEPDGKGRQKGMPDSETGITHGMRT